MPGGGGNTGGGTSAAKTELLYFFTNTSLPDWEEIKLEQMYNNCMAKFFQHPDLREKLLQTCCRPLFEGNTWGDRYWGTVNGYGENHLGIILMDIRAKLQNELVYHADMMA